MARLTPRAALLGAFTLTIALLAGMPVTSVAADEEPGSPTTTTEPAPNSVPPPEPAGTQTPAPTETPAPSEEPRPPGEPPAGSAEPPAPQPVGAAADDVPDLRVTATFDKVDYLGSDRVTVTVTITNVSAVDAPDMSGDTDGNLSLEGNSAGIDFGTETTIRAGATRVIERSGYLYDLTASSVFINVGVRSGSGDAQPDDNVSRIQAPVRPATATFAGLVFGDQDTDGVLDPTERGLANVSISLSGGGVGTRTGSTDPAGRFSIPDLPAGRYSVTYTAQGWVVPGGIAAPNFVVVAPQDPAALVAALPSLDNLRSTVLFDRDSYQNGDTAGLTVVLSNIGSFPFTGVKATCADYPSMAGVTVGPGWGALGGAGITVPAGQAVIARVSTPVPAKASRFGFFSAYCGFQPDRYPPGGPGFFPATARVPGDTGVGRGRLEWDDFSGAAGIPVVITDPVTGTEVARATTDADGYFTVDGLPAALYDVRIDGPWVPAFGAMITLAVETGSPYQGLRFWRIKPGTAAANLRPNLVASASFEKPSYRPDEKLYRVRLTVTNIGPAAAQGVVLGGNPGDPALPLISADLGELNPLGPGARIEAGATRVFDMQTTNVFNPKAAMVFAGRLEPKARDIFWVHGQFTAVAQVDLGRGSYTGVLYGDENNNGVMDSGEGLARIPVYLDGGAPYGQYHQVTDAEGRFTFPDIPSGRYSPRYALPDGWYIGYGEVVVATGDPTVVEVRAFRANEDLLAAVAFDRNSYAVGDTANITITLTNRSATDQTGITTLCTGPGNSNEIYSYGPGWGDIADGGPGVTVPAHSTVTFQVWTIIPDGGLIWGYVSLDCIFGAPPSYGPSPAAYAQAKVPGGFGRPGGVLLYDRPDQEQGIPDTKVVLTDQITGAVVSRAVTDATGHFKFPDTPAGRYDVLVVGPWKITECDCFAVWAGDDRDTFRIRVVPGAVQPDPDATPADPPPADPEPAPQDEVLASTAQLASTGAAVTALLAGGILLLLAGLGLVLPRRRSHRPG